MNLITNNIAYIVGGALAFIVLSSKNIIIYNEEILIAISFLGFVVFSSQTMSDSIAESFDARSQAIQSELQSYYDFKEEVIRELLEEHKRQLGLHQAVKALGQISCEEIVALYSQREKALESVFASQIQQKLKTLIQSQKGIQQNLQGAVVGGFREAVLEEFKLSKAKLGPKLIDQALETLKSTK